MASGPDQAQKVEDKLFNLHTAYYIIVALFHARNNVTHCDARKSLAGSLLLSVQNEMLMREFDQSLPDSIPLGW